MFPVIPIRTSLRRSGWALLMLSLIPTYVGAATHHLTSRGVELAPPSDGRSWALFAFVSSAVIVIGWVYANEKWSKWRDGGLAQSVTLAQPPVTRVRWRWTTTHVVLAVLSLMLVGGVAVLIAKMGRDEFPFITAFAVPYGALGVSYLVLAQRLSKLEQERGIVYYWQRLPLPVATDFARVGVYTVPVHAVLV